MQPGIMTGISFEPFRKNVASDFTGEHDWDPPNDRSPSTHEQGNMIEMPLVFSQLKDGKSCQVRKHCMRSHHFLPEIPDREMS
jgi:hypothetical protein